MKTNLPQAICSILLLCTLGMASAEMTKPNPNSPNAIKQAKQNAKEKTPVWVEQFNKLSDQQKKEYVLTFRQAEQLFAQNRIIETIGILDRLEKIFPDNPGLYNMKGSCYLKIKDIPASITNFKKAFDMNPDNNSVLFNLAEVYFVSHDYKTAINEFNHLLKQLSKEREAPLLMKSLIQFKQFICYTKLGDTNKAKEYETLYTQSDDTPYYYCIQAVKQIQEGKTDAGQLSILSAARIYESSGMFQPFSDTLSEVGLIPSIEGPTVPEKKTTSTPQ
ncbi:MAG: hypothetical protein RSE01_06375 [Akkermansia sp.]